MIKINASITIEEIIEIRNTNNLFRLKLTDGKYYLARIKKENENYTLEIITNELNSCDLYCDDFGNICTSRYFLNKEGLPIYNNKLYEHKFKFLRGFFNGLAPGITNDGKKGYFDISGNLCIDCQNDKSISCFKSGLALIEDENGNVSYINTYGEKVIENIQDNYKEWYDFSENLAVLRKTNGNFVYLNTSGEIAIEKNAKKILSFHKGVAFILLEDNSIVSIDKNGKILFSIPKNEWENAKNLEENGILIIKRNKYKYDFSDAYGNILHTYELNESDIDIIDLDNITFIPEIGIVDFNNRRIKNGNTIIPIKKIVVANTVTEKNETLKAIDGTILNDNDIYNIHEKPTETTSAPPSKGLSTSSKDKLFSLMDKIQNKYIGQENPVTKLCTLILNNQRMNEVYADDLEYITASKATILLEGATGTGKTGILTALAKELNVPIISRKINTYTPTGYKGNELALIFLDLLKATDMDIEKAEKGIIVLDEFDKLTSDNNELQESLQNELLGYIEGAEVTIELPSTSKHITIDTSKMTFICSGAFSNLRNENDSEITDTELIENGYKEELIARLKNKISLKKYTKDDYINIILNSTLSPLLNLRKTLAMYGYNDYDFVITQNFLEEVATEAVKLDQGVRGLQSIFNEILEENLLYIMTGVEESIILTNYKPKKGYDKK